MKAPPRVLLAGASGAIGSRVLRLLKARGVRVRALSRDPRRAIGLDADEHVLVDAASAGGLDAATRGVEIVISCLGANVSLRLRERRSYTQLDPLANANLLDAALATGVRRFVYIGVHTAPGYDQTRYCVAHEGFVERLRAAKISSTVLRPTGVMSALDDLLVMARMGLGTVVGDGEALTNPIHPDDVALAVVDALEEGPQDRTLGGPEVLSRRALVGCAFSALGKPLRAIHVPAALFRLNSLLLRPLHPRLSELLEFVAEVSTHDAVAEVAGERTLSEWYQGRLQLSAGARA